MPSTPRRLADFPRSSPLCGVFFAAAVAIGWPAHALEIDGVQPAALDQPRITVTLRASPQGEPIVAEAAAGGLAAQQSEMLKDLLSDPALQGMAGELKSQGIDLESMLAGGSGGGPGAFTAFLDTGASGMMISGTQAAAMGLELATTSGGREVTFVDVGVGGAVNFGVTNPLYVELTPHGKGTIGEHDAGPYRWKVKPGGGMLEAMVGPVNLVGMPAMMGRVMVIDASGLGDLQLLKTSLLPPRHPDIPRPSRDTLRVPLTYVDFEGFTEIIPRSADRPSFGPSPMIGPDPVADTPDEAEPMRLTHHGQEVAASWLVDTGAVASIVSEQHANHLGVTLRPDGSGLDGPGTQRQFTLPIGGVGGVKQVHGFFIERLVVPTQGGEPLVYRNAPALVLDITITHPETGEVFTLDGVFGMNYLVGSALVSAGGGGMMGMPSIGDIRDTPFTYTVIDHPGEVMLLHPKDHGAAAAAPSSRR
ncbi:MAG: hypothetical protein AAF842_05885 [Planctomycetota bacterium]